MSCVTVLTYVVAVLKPKEDKIYCSGYGDNQANKQNSFCVLLGSECLVSILHLSPLLPGIEFLKGLKYLDILFAHLFKHAN